MDEEKQSKPIPPAWNVLHRRWTRPSKQWSFWTFLLVGIGILGALGVWIEGVRYFTFEPTPSDKTADLEPFKLALATAGLAIAGPSAMQLLYSRDKLAIVAAILLFTVEMVASMYLIVFGEPGIWLTLIVGAICVIVAIVAWILANGEDDIFQDEIHGDAPAGGDPMRPMRSRDAPAKV